MNKLVLIFIALPLLFSCSKSGNSSTPTTNFFPPVAVNVTVNLTLPQNNALLQLQGWKYEPGGNKGLVIYHTINDVYVAFDRTCPVNPTDTCAYVSMDSSGTYYSCSKTHIIGPICSSTSAGICKSTFLPDNGFPRSGSATIPLRQYNVKYDADFIYITN